MVATKHTHTHILNQIWSHYIYVQPDQMSVVGDAAAAAAAASLQW